MHAVVDDADQEEHAGRADAVGDHLEHGAADAHLPILGDVEVAGRRAPDADAQEHVAHVADRAVGDQPFEVLLGHGGQGAVDHAQHADAADEPGQTSARRPGRSDNRPAARRTRPSSTTRRPGSSRSGVGASTWASGSHVWTGTAGNLMTKPTNSSKNAQNWIDLPPSSGALKGDFSIWPIAARARMLKVCDRLGRRCTRISRAGLSNFRLRKWTVRRRPCAGRTCRPRQAAARASARAGRWRSRASAGR